MFMTREKLSPAVQALLSTSSHVYSQALIWGDMDAFGHLNNVHFYRYFESARIDAINTLGGFAKDGQIVVIAESNCKFLRPVVYPDMLHVGVSIKRLGRTSLTMHYRMISEAQEALAAEGDAVIVYIGENGKPTPMSDDIRSKLTHWLVEPS